MEQRHSRRIWSLCLVLQGRLRPSQRRRYRTWAQRLRIDCQRRRSLRYQSSQEQGTGTRRRQHLFGHVAALRICWEASERQLAVLKGVIVDQWGVGK
jgi:hypothetical protein